VYTPIRTCGRRSIMSDYEHTLDCKALNCPLPIIRIKRKFSEVPIGEDLYVEATDPGFKDDLHAWTKKTNNTIVKFDKTPEFQFAVIRREV